MSLHDALLAKAFGGGSGGSGGGTSIDVTAEVGQTIVVKEVDENGKPAKWESAEYQPRTHWSEDVIGDLVPHTEFTPVLNEAFQCCFMICPSLILQKEKPTRLYSTVWNIRARRRRVCLAMFISFLWETPIYTVCNLQSLLSWRKFLLWVYLRWYALPLTPTRFKLSVRKQYTTKSPTNTHPQLTIAL